MKKSSWLPLIVVGIFTSFAAEAADCNSLNGSAATPSNFDTNATWSCSHAPTSNADNVTVSHYVTRSSSVTWQWGAQTITVNSGGYLKIVGDLTLKGSGNKIIINNGGTLEVTGTLTIENGGVTLDVENGGNLKVGTMQINAGSTLTVKSGGSSTIGTLNVGNHSTAKFDNKGTTHVTGNMTVEGPATNTGSLDVDTDLIVSSSGSASFSTTGGTVNVDGNASSANTFKVGPGAYVYIKGNFTTTSNEGLTVGTDVAPTPYADMVINGNLLSASSGDVRVKDNGRLAIFGDFKKTTNSGGILLNVESKGQVYLHGNIDFSGAGGGGNIITNDNTTSPYGLYYDGTTPSNATLSSNTATSTVMQTTNPTFYNWIATQPGNLFSAMPITLQYFRTGDKQNDGILIEWATAIEKDFNFFEVEFSRDGLSFGTLTTIRGVGESNKLVRYGYQHRSPVSGKNYYRLKSVDRDNSYEYSAVIMGYWNGETNGLTVYPNPVLNGLLRIHASDEEQQVERIAIYDQAGLLVWEITDSKALEIHLPPAISSGIYLLALTNKVATRMVRLEVR
jgi:hypothetical protein